MKFLCALAVFCALFGLGFTMCKQAYASELAMQETTSQEAVDQTQEPTQEIPNEEVLDDITFQEQLDDFLNKWVTPVLSCFSGAVGALFTVILSFAKVKKLSKEVKEITDLSNEERKRNEIELMRAEANLKEAKLNLDTFINENKVLLEQALTSVQTLDMFKELVSLLVLSDPNYVNNPYASQIVKLLNEGDTNVNKEN